MGKFLIIYGLTAAEYDTDSIMLSKRLDFCRAVHRYGLAWSGRGGTVILKADITLNKLSRELVSLISDDEFVAVVAISENPAVMYGGWLVDDESFLELLPGAIDVTYDDPGYGDSALN